MPVNIEINDSNFSLGPINGFFYTVNKQINSLLQIEADGTVVNTFPMTRSQFRNPILELHYDGTFFWTMEELPSNLGMVIKKWRLHPHKTADFPNAAPSEFRWQDEITLLNLPNIKYQSEAFCVEHYHRSIQGAANQGDFTIKVSDVTDIDLGDVLYLGPSDFAGFIGQEEEITVLGINTSTKDISFFKQGGLESSYGPGNDVDFQKGLWVFNDHSFSGTRDDRGSLIKFEYPSLNLATIDTGAKYSGVTAADFDLTSLIFVRGPMIMKLNLNTTTFDLESSLEANLIQSNKYQLIKVYDLISDLANNLYYKLQQKETTEDLSTGTLTTVDFTPDYNFQIQPILPFVNSTALRFEPTRFAITGASPKSRKFTVYAEVRDQFNFPVLGKSIQFTNTVASEGDPGIPGTMDPAVDVTNVSGTARSEFTPSATPTDIILNIKAQVL
ncbi:hypothetical protein LCGC14_1095690 [marine sediment metagenome]|uniref:Uncharacterized protein n=1 Tax=marine sediment metagenome TaxID=412755 RepID=A0A0F9MYT5_9ZZZZ